MISVKNTQNSYHSISTHNSGKMSSSEPASIINLSGKGGSCTLQYTISEDENRVHETTGSV